MLLNAFRQQIKQLIATFKDSSGPDMVDLSPILSDSIYNCQMCLFRLMKHALKIKPNTMVTKAIIEEASSSWIYMVPQEILRLKAAQLSDPSLAPYVTIDLQAPVGRDGRDILSSLALYNLPGPLTVTKSFYDTERSSSSKVSLERNSFPQFHPAMCDAFANKDEASLMLLLSGSRNSSFTLNTLISNLHFDEYENIESPRLRMCKIIFEQLRDNERSGLKPGVAEYMSIVNIPSENKWCKHESKSSSHMNASTLGYHSSAISLRKRSSDLPQCSIARLSLSEVTKDCVMHSIVSGQPMLLYADDNHIDFSSWSMESLQQIQHKNVITGELPYASLFGMNEKAVSIQDYLTAKGGVRQQTQKLLKLEELRRSILAQFGIIPELDEAVKLNIELFALVRKTSPENRRSIVQDVVRLLVEEKGILDNPSELDDEMVTLVMKYIRAFTDAIKNPKQYMFAWEKLKIGLECKQ